MHKHVHGMARGAGRFDVASSPLRRLLHLMQGDAVPALADIGLTRLADADLVDVVALASDESMRSLDCAALLLGLLERLRARDDTEPGLVRDATGHAARLLRTHRIWQELADDAADHLDRPALRTRLALDSAPSHCD